MKTGSNRESKRAASLLKECAECYVFVPHTEMESDKASRSRPRHGADTFSVQILNENCSHFSRIYAKLCITVGIVQPIVQPPLGKPTRWTDALEYLRGVVDELLLHPCAWPFKEPVDAVKLEIPVCDANFSCVNACSMGAQYTYCSIIIASSRTRWIWERSRSVSKMATTAARRNASMCVNFMNLFV